MSNIKLFKPPIDLHLIFQTQFFQKSSADQLGGKSTFTMKNQFMLLSYIITFDEQLLELPFFANIESKNVLFSKIM